MYLCFLKMNILYQNLRVLWACAWWRHDMKTFFSRLWPFVRGTTDHRWIPITKGQWLGLFFSYKTLFLRNYIRLHTASSYQIDGPAKTETIPLLMQWNRLSPIPKSSRWYQYIYMQTATYNKHPQTCFNKHNRYVNHIKITVHSIMSLKYMSPSSFHQLCSLLTTCHRDLVMLFYNIAFSPQCMHHKLEYDRYLINRHQPNQRET